MPRMFEVHRFTREEHDQGATAGWQFTAGWFTRDSGLQWAWFCKEVQHDEAQDGP